MPNKSSERARNIFKIVPKNINRWPKGEKIQVRIFLTIHYFKIFSEVLTAFILLNATLNFCCSRVTYLNEQSWRKTTEWRNQTQSAHSFSYKNFTENSVCSNVAPNANVYQERNQTFLCFKQVSHLICTKKMSLSYFFCGKISVTSRYADKRKAELWIVSKFAKVCFNINHAKEKC